MTKPSTAALRARRGGRTPADHGIGRLTVMYASQASQIELLRRACASASGVLGSVTRGQLTHPTPCGDWQVRDLIDHIVGAAGFFAGIAEQGSSPLEREWPSYCDGDFAAAFGRHASRLVAAFAATGAMEAVMALPTGPAPGSRCIQVATGEMFVHGWDLAKAAGQAVSFDEGVAEALLSSQWPALCAEVRNSDPSVFAAAIGVPHDATATDRLAGLLGRDPGWRNRQ